MVAAIKEKAAAEEGEEGVDGGAKALLTTTATVPFKLKQVKLADFYITSTKAAAAKEDALAPPRKSKGGPKRQEKEQGPGDQQQSRRRGALADPPGPPGR